MIALSAFIENIIGSHRSQAPLKVLVSGCLWKVCCKRVQVVTE